MGPVVVSSAAPLVGKGRAVACSMDLTMDGVSMGWADSIKATVPATKGAEKLVPTLALKESVWVEDTGPVVPVLLAASMGYRHGALAVVLTQLPPGALMVISGPKSEKPTLVPMWRKPATAITPGQLAGVPTAWPELLPAEATITAVGEELQLHDDHPAQSPRLRPFGGGIQIQINVPTLPNDVPDI